MKPSSVGTRFLNENQPHILKQNLSSFGESRIFLTNTIHITFPAW